MGGFFNMDNFSVLKGEDLFKNNIPIYLNIAPAEDRNTTLLHKHDFIEIAYVNSGKGKHLIGNEQYEVSKGNLCIINYDIPHVFIQDASSTESNLINYNCVFNPEFIDYSLIHTNDFKGIASSLLFNTFFIEDKPAVSLKLSGTLQAEIEELFRKMQQEFFTMRNGYVNILRSCLIEMLTKIFRFLEEEQNHSSKQENYKSKIMDKAFDFLKENYHSSSLNINEVAVRTFLSRSYFSKLFKEVTGQNFSEYLQNLRISEACTLLKTTNKKITEILSDVGFNDVKHFNQLFKKLTSKTPSEYRKCN